MQNINVSRFWMHAVAFLFFSLLVVYLTYPLIFHMGDIATGNGDQFLSAWIMNWDIHSFLTNPLHIFDAPIYYPYHNSLAYSDALVPSSILAAIPLWIVKQPIVTENFTFFSSFVFLGFFTYIFTYYLTKNFGASLLSGVLLIFSPATIDKWVHVQVLAIWGVPLALLFFIHFLKIGKTSVLVASLACFVIQTYNSFLPGYFILFTYLSIIIFFFANNRVTFKKLFIRKHIILLLLSFALIIPITIPYYGVSHEFHYVRDIRETIHFALQPEDFLTVGNNSRLQPFLSQIFPAKNYPSNAEIKPGFIGLELLLLSIGVGIYLAKNRREKGNWIIWALVAAGLFGIVLSLGPALHIDRKTIHYPFPIILPYTLLYYLMPGFQGLRNSERWEMLFVLLIVVCIGVVLDRILKKQSSVVKIIVYVALLAGAIGEYNFPMQFMSIIQVKDFPKEYIWLQTTPPHSSIVEMPIFNWDMQPYDQIELTRGYYNTQYFRKTMSGFSGFSPPPWQILVTHLLATFPNEQAIQELHHLHITYVLVHTDEYDMLRAAQYKVNNILMPDGKTVLTTLEQNKKVKLIRTFGNTTIFQLQ